MQNEPRFYTEKHARLEEIRISEIKTQLDNMDFESRKEVWNYLNSQIIRINQNVEYSVEGEPDTTAPIRKRRQIIPARVMNCERCNGKGYHGNMFRKNWCYNCNSLGKVFC